MWNKQIYNHLKGPAGLGDIINLIYNISNYKGSFMSQQFKQTLNTSQVQTIKITPQLQQAIKLLQMSRLELETTVRKEMEENPALEEALESSTEDLKEGELRDTKESDIEAHDDPRKADQDEFDWEKYVESASATDQTVTKYHKEEARNYENVISSTKTLSDHLNWQLGLSGFSDEELHIVGKLLEYVEDDGYIKTPLDKISVEENIALKDLEENLVLVHEFDPPGVGARNLEECLLIQAKHLEEDTKDVVELIQNHLKDLEKRDYETIAKSMNLSVKYIEELCKVVFDMDPKPGNAFSSSSDVQYVTPDVFVTKVNGEYMINLNDEGVPRLKISNFYRQAIRKGSLEKAEAKNYIKEKLTSAKFLIKSIEQRQKTISRVSTSIVRHQMDFFEKGKDHIKPMILRDIANDVGLHESTVSRVTSNKYMHTPRGVFELKYFFNSGVSSESGEFVASNSVKSQIKNIINNENPKKPYSDIKLMEMLQAKGINIARRTVAKYRESLGISTSRDRKRFH